MILLSDFVKFYVRASPIFAAAGLISDNENMKSKDNGVARFDKDNQAAECE